VGTPIRERVDGIERLVREQLDNAIRSVDESNEGMRNLLGDTSVGLHRRLEDLAARPAVDPTDSLNSLEKRLEALAARLDAIEESMSGRIGSLGGTLDEKLGKLDAAIVERPDTDSLRSLVERANAESERRHAGQLDEAMATFAELILGRGPSVHQMPPPPPRQTPRRNRSKVTVKSPNGASAHDTVTDDPDV